MKAEIGLEEMEKAYERLEGKIHRTPIMESSLIDQVIGLPVKFKCEHLQKTGSFKSRGALNSTLRAKEAGAKGVITHSSGNHGQALAWAAKSCGLPCTVVVPENAPPSKREAIAAYDADVRLCQPTVKAREEDCQRLSKELGYTVVEPFNEPDMINGHASIVKEIFEQEPETDSIFVSLGGGGFASAIAYYTAKTHPDVKVFVVEPQGKFLKQYLDEGTLPENDVVNTIADGVRVLRIGDYCKPIIEAHCKDNLITVNDDEIREAMRLVWTRLKQRVEPTACMALAALLHYKPSTVHRPMVILCGGNVDLNFLP
ncbi:unnamed protein product [Caenorhabditis auriculariae]|uniref:Serine racemase n=1 Tax=Caenorhabditis auriculariae TaxID=2777116 RepID=A0A8S1GU86_9PELO|nr:unnamed protein product [Caenorhabditis auriculariae]